eukprot:CAMPEP_0114470744 /NCGR_PEP_ID=MMETSP0104-20121206/11432_1 /TAXON_ID=37642 ORGANISM="Paraphysomonas imperforata, Strain PA2" /NCGR_SAMPLE_ID=MMETSP0104 /ASSEMBLY_ACC=CAM_ASM_000202 /LENGTH=158 /DNA_ID=CAMNT_0001644523 /DNA_START=564 /DNA_END=1040 /DNA_ORIENTATION=-
MSAAGESTKQKPKSNKRKTTPASESIISDELEGSTMETSTPPKARTSKATGKRRKKAAATEVTDVSQETPTPQDTTPAVVNSTTGGDGKTDGSLSEDANNEVPTPQDTTPAVVNSTTGGDGKTDGSLSEDANNEVHDIIHRDNILPQTHPHTCSTHIS